MTPAQTQQLAWLNAPEPASTELVPAVRTHWSLLEVARAIRRAWSALYGSTPKDAAVAVLLAQWALETGWGASCWGSNLGNMRPPASRGCLCLQIPGDHVSEVIGGREYFFAPPSRGSTFQAFEDLDKGAEFYMGFLITRYSSAWPAVVAGDIAGFSHLIRQRGYYTAFEAQYTTTLRSCFAHVLRTLSDDGVDPGERPAISDELRAAVKAQLFELYDGAPHGAADIREEEADGTE